MSSSIGTGSRSSFQITPQQSHQVAQTQAPIDTNQIEGLAHSDAGVRTDVPIQDNYGGRVKADGLKAIDAGFTENDASTTELFRQCNLPPIYNANTTNVTANTFANDPVFKETTQAISSALTSNTAVDNPALANKVAEFCAGKTNPMEALYLVFRESIKENNEDRKYFLHKIQEYNKLSESLADYLKELTKASNDLTQIEKTHDGQDPAKAAKCTDTISFSVKNFETGFLGSDGNAISVTAEPKLMQRADIDLAIKDLESMKELVSNNRQQASTAFQNFDQKGNQLMNLLSTVIKSMNEMRSIGAASRSGL